MTDHTPTPWNCASRYSSVVGVPIINQQGKRIGNTALPDMPPQWDHMKRQAEIDAAFICKAVNAYAVLVKALEVERDYWADRVADMAADMQEGGSFKKDIMAMYSERAENINGVLRAVGGSRDG
jgi:hypothetical protein